MEENKPKLKIQKIWLPDVGKDIYAFESPIKEIALIVTDFPCDGDMCIREVEKPILESTIDTPRLYEEGQVYMFVHYIEDTDELEYHGFKKGEAEKLFVKMREDLNEDEIATDAELIYALYMAKLKLEGEKKDD